MKFFVPKPLPGLLAGALLAVIAIPIANACTRVLYVGQGNLVITGRSMDWSQPMGTNLWALPAGQKHSGHAGSNSLHWTSKYGSVIAVPYGAGVDETVNALKAEPFQIVAPTLPNGSASSLHLAISDASGGSAIFEYIEGKLVIHHGKQYTVMTNSPAYDQQIAIEKYWQSVGGEHFLPGTYRAADRFARASFLLNAIPKKPDPTFIDAVPNRSFAYQAVASVLGLVRDVGVPIGVSTDKPNIASTLWRTVADQKHRVYYFDSATRPNTFWVDLGKLNLKRGAPIEELKMAHGQVYAGETSAKFVPAKMFTPLNASPKTAGKS